MEDKLKDSLDTLGEEETSHLLDMDLNFDIDKKTLRRIKASVNKKIGADKKSPLFSRRFIACALTLMVIIGAMAAVGFDNVAAAVRQTVQYIPGFGRVPELQNGGSPEKTANMLEVKVMKEPVFIQLRGQKVEIYSSWVCVYKDEAIVTTILNYPQGLELDGEIMLEYNGKRICRDGEFPGYSIIKDKDKEMTYTYTIRGVGSPINTLTFRAEESRVEIPFKTAADLKDKAISQNFNGIVISAIPLNENRSRLILNSDYEKSLVGVKFTSSFTGGINAEIKAIDEAGKEYEVRRATSQGSEYYVEGTLEGKIVSLKFNKLKLGFKYENSSNIKGVKFKVPNGDEKVSIGKSLDNSICSLKLRTVERIKHTNEKPYNFMFTYELKGKIPNLDIDNLPLYVEKNEGIMAACILEKYKDGNRYIFKCGVIGDDNAAENTVNIVSYGTYQHNTLALDKECILELK